MRIKEKIIEQMQAEAIAKNVPATPQEMWKEQRTGSFVSLNEAREIYQWHLEPRMNQAKSSERVLKHVGQSIFQGQSKLIQSIITDTPYDIRYYKHNGDNLESKTWTECIHVINILNEFDTDTLEERQGEIINLLLNG